MLFIVRAQYITRTTYRTRDVHRSPSLFFLTSVGAVVVTAFSSWDWWFLFATFPSQSHKGFVSFVEVIFKELASGFVNFSQLFQFH